MAFHANPLIVTRLPFLSLPSMPADVDPSYILSGGSREVLLQVTALRKMERGLYTGSPPEMNSDLSVSGCAHPSSA